MLTFKRNNEGHEFIYYDDVCVVKFITKEEDPVAYKALGFKRLSNIVSDNDVVNAIDIISEMEFWNDSQPKEFSFDLKNFIHLL